MLIENFEKVTSKPKIDKVNGILRDVVLFSTEFNLNKNAKFTDKNLKELVDLGSKEKTYSYLGHARKGVLSTDRLPYRLGHFENYSIDGTKVKADLILSKTIEANPILPKDIKEYIYALAENEANDCGFSVSVGFDYISDGNDFVELKEVYSIDLVESPALTLAMFAKEENTMPEETVNENLSPVLEAIKTLSLALDSKGDIGPSVEAIKAALATLTPVQVAVSEAVEAIVEENEIHQTVIETIVETVVDAQAVEVETPSEIETLKSEFAAIKETLSKIQESLLTKETFAKEAPTKEPVVFHVNPVVSNSVDNSKADKKFHREEYHNLLKTDKAEAAKYHKLYLS